MGSVIHMETEEVREVARQLDRISAEIDQEIAQLGNKLRALNWQSPTRDEFIGDFSEWQRKIQICAEQGAALGSRVQREVEEWEQAASRLDAGNLTAEQQRALAITDTRQSIKKKWTDMLLEERNQWLEDWYKNLCKKYGITPVDFKVKDLPDPEDGDYRGKYSKGFIFGLFSSLTVDVDNVKGDDPFQVIETVAHESRHQYQHYLVDHPEKHPPDISEEQINSWKENFDNYKSGEDDFEAYWNQPVEADARQAGKLGVREYIESGVEKI